MVYDEKDLALLDSYIRQNIGSFSEVMHELVSPNLHIDIAVIPPTEKKNYYTLVTMGMGTYSMNVPAPHAKAKLTRAEIAILLPEDWDLHSMDEKWYWLIRWLKILARMPINYKTWLGYGHSISCGGPVADNTNFCGLALDILFDGDAELLWLTNGDGVLMYKVIPIYQEEMDFKQSASCKELFEKIGKATLNSPINTSRKNVCLE